MQMSPDSRAAAAAAGVVDDTHGLARVFVFRVNEREKVFGSGQPKTFTTFWG